MLKLMGKKTFKPLAQNFLLSPTYAGPLLTHLPPMHRAGDVRLDWTPDLT